MPVRKLHLCLAVLVSAGAGSASANDDSARSATDQPYTVWTTALTVNKAQETFARRDLVRAVIVPSGVATATKTLDLNALSMSDFGDVEAPRP